MGDPALGLCVVVLAAGSSLRMGESNKLLLPVDGEPMLAHALRAACTCGADAVFLLTGHQRAPINDVAEPFVVQEIHNPDHRDGQDGSLWVAANALRPKGSSVLVMLGDQPAVKAPLLRQLIKAHRQDGGARALVPTHLGQWGTPRILSPGLIERLAKGEGHLSMRRLLASAEVALQLLEVNDAAVLHDIDTPADYRAFTQ